VIYFLSGVIIIMNTSIKLSQLNPDLTEHDSNYGSGMGRGSDYGDGIYYNGCGYSSDKGHGF